MPFILIILFGFAISTEVKDSRTAILDFSKDEVTGEICELIDANRYFTLTHYPDNIDQANKLLKEGKIDMVIIFSEEFSREIKHSGSASIQIITDGTEPNQASVRTGYAKQLLSAYLKEHANGIKPAYQITPITKMLYNPQSKSEYNFVPGVIGLILMLICTMMTSIAIVKEKETGTMEILLASPLAPITIVLAKLVPYLVISCINLATILILSVMLLHIPIAGSLTGFILISLLYTMTALFLGLLISTAVKTQLAAMLLSLLVIVPTVYLSGITFPIESMPEILRYISSIVPTRWYVEIARKLMIQGVELRYVMKETLILLLMAIAIISISWKLFKTRLE